jgi:hypothetical protein
VSSTDSEIMNYMLETSLKLCIRILFLDTKVSGAFYWTDRIGRYLTSNVNITVDGTSVPIGSRYRKFTTPINNYTVLAFGVLFDFTGYSSIFTILI